MSRSKSIDALLKKSNKDLVILKKDYEAALHAKQISEEIKIDIKNIFENLRSALDYLAHDISEHLATSKPKILYFPIRHSLAEFTATMAKDYPGVEGNNTDIYSILEQVQPYNKPWLGNFNKLNNNNKHQKLVEQTRTESRHVSVTSHGSGGGVSWGPGVTFGGNISVMGVPIDPYTQLPVPNNQVKTEITIWINFIFEDIGESVLPFIQQSITEVCNIHEKTSKHLNG